MTQIGAELLLYAGTAVDFAESVEVATFCPVCEKTDRTIDFTREGAVCRGQGHAFPGRMFAREVVTEGGRQRASYVFESPEGKPLPSWGRIRFVATCGACGKTTRGSIQNNEQRPKETRCACGQLLVTDEQKQPTFRRVEA